jgi:hypothetical protein
MHMKLNTNCTLAILAACLFCCSCSHPDAPAGLQLNGTWQLISGMTITKNDSSPRLDTVLYATNFRMIKILNDSHFAFLRHDLHPPKDSSNHFDAGGGAYTLSGDQYTEHLDYYSDRLWEGKPFTFTVTLRNDTLTQTGIEKVDSAHVNHTIIEQYVRVSPAAQ